MIIKKNQNIQTGKNACGPGFPVPKGEVTVGPEMKPNSKTRRRSQSSVMTLMWNGTSSFGPKSDGAWKLSWPGEQGNAVEGERGLCL